MRKMWRQAFLGQGFLQQLQLHPFSFTALHLFMILTICWTTRYRRSSSDVGRPETQRFDSLTQRLAFGFSCAGRPEASTIGCRSCTTAFGRGATRKVKGCQRALQHDSTQPNFIQFHSMSGDQRGPSSFGGQLFAGS